jgi:hypothetical protein
MVTGELFTSIRNNRDRLCGRQIVFGSHEPAGSGADSKTTMVIT